MKKWTLMLKSHAVNAPDLEETVEAKTKESAMGEFRYRFPDLKEWNDFELLQNMQEEKLSTYPQI